MIYFNTSSAAIKIYNGSGWKTVADLDTAQTLSNKTLGSTNTLTGATATNFTGSGASTITLPTSTSTLATLALSESLTNKNLASATNTLTGATAGSFTNTGTVTLFTASDTVVGRATTDTLTNKYLQGGTASTTNRIKIPNDTAANLATLAGSLTEGDLVFDLTNHQINYKTNSALVAVAAASVATSTATGTVTSFVPVILSSVKTVSSAGYTILDNDGYDVILVSTGGSNRTIELPVVANNAGRKIKFKKTDSGTGGLIIDGASSETIDGATSATIYKQYGEADIVATGLLGILCRANRTRHYTRTQTTLLHCRFTNILPFHPRGT